MTTDLPEIEAQFADRCANAAANLRRLAELSARPEADTEALADAAGLTASLLSDPDALLAVALVSERGRGPEARATFAAGYGAGWDASCEGHNGEYVSERKDRDNPGWFERARDQAFEEYLTPRQDRPAGAEPEVRPDIGRGEG